MIMKKIIPILMIAIGAVCGCTQEPRPSLDQARVTDLRIIISPGEVQNTYLLRSNRTDVICFWNLGNGNTASGVNSVLAKYPFAGVYTITLKAYSDAGATNEVSVTLPVITENLYLLNDPIYELVAGPVGGEGKTWKLDSGRQGHITLLHPNNFEDAWYTAGPGAKDGCEMYDDRITFFLNCERGQAVEYVNNGKSSAINNATALDELFTDGAWQATSYNRASTNDFIIDCVPPASMGWSLLQNAGRYYLSFPATGEGNGAYMFYFSGWQTQYEIRAISENYMKVYAWANLAGSTSLRQLILCTEETAPGNDDIEWTWIKD